MSTAELVPSVSITNLVNQRAALLQRLGQAFDLINEAAEIAAEAKLGMPDLTIGAGYGYRNTGRRIAAARIAPARITTARRPIAPNSTRWRAWAWTAQAGST